MFASVEAFYRPVTVREALHLLQKGKGSARIVAGCTDILAGARDRSHPAIRSLIDISKAGLNYIRTERAGDVQWSIGATITMAELEQSARIRGLAGGVLACAAASCGSIEIRNMATVGGNLVNGSPAADLATPLLVLDALAVVATLRRERKIPLADYLAASREDAPDSLLVEVAFPDPPRGAHCGWSFQKLGRTALDIALVNVAAGIQLDARRRVKWVRLALGAVAPTPIRVPLTESWMAGQTLDRALIAQAGTKTLEEICPISDSRASAEYRREMSRVLVERALEECAQNAGCSL